MKKKIGSKFIITVLALTLVLGVLPGVAFADILPLWENAEELPSKSGTYYLDTDVTINETWIVPEGATILFLNGHGIRYDGDNGSVISIGENSILYLYDNENNKTEHFVTLKNWRGIKVDDSKTDVPVDTNGNGVVKVTGGFITGGYGTDNNGYGGGIYDRGQLIMSGGTILGNSVTHRGGGVYVVHPENAEKKGMFHLIAGSISYNSAGDKGGGVCMSNNATFNMSGGTIANNATAGDGGGLYVTALCRFHMSGGAITDNTSSSEHDEYVGGGVWISSYSDKDFYTSISGTARITGNKTGNKEKNIYLDDLPYVKDPTRIIISDALDESARIGVTMKTPGVFTKGLNEKLPNGKIAADLFFSDDPQYTVQTDNSNEAFLKQKDNTPSLDPEEGDNGNGTITEPVSTPRGTPLATMTAKGKNRLVIRWTEVKGAAGYDIFFAECKHNDKATIKKKVKTIKAGKRLSWTKKGLKKGASYKACVKAFVMKNGKKVYVGTSPAVHAFTGGYTKGYTNAKAVSVKKTNITLGKGKNFKIKAKVIKLKKNKKLMPKSHAPKLRYLSTDKKIATVSSKGKIKAKGKGTCYVYVYAHNGVSKKIKVTVR